MSQLNEAIQKMIIDALSNTHTATVGRVVKVNEKTIDVQPVINMVYNGEDIVLPVFAEVPPVFMQGGGSYTAHPIAVGDYALLVFSERSFDRWYSGSDEVRPPELRMHDYSDAFAFVGVNTLSDAITIPDVITQVGDTDKTGNHVHNGNYTLTGNMVINGNLTVNGDINCTGTLTVPNINATVGATIGGIPFATHVHPENDGGNTGTPI